MLATVLCRFHSWQLFSSEQRIHCRIYGTLSVRGNKQDDNNEDVEETTRDSTISVTVCYRVRPTSSNSWESYDISPHQSETARIQ